jgi:hypothetical protein
MIEEPETLFRSSSRSPVSLKFLKAPFKLLKRSSVPLCRAARQRTEEASVKERSASVKLGKVRASSFGEVVTSCIKAETLTASNLILMNCCAKSDADGLKRGI